MTTDPTAVPSNFNLAGVTFSARCPGCVALADWSATLVPVDGSARQTVAYSVACCEPERPATALSLTLPHETPVPSHSVSTDRRSAP